MATGSLPDLAGMKASKLMIDFSSPGSSVAILMLQHSDGSARVFTLKGLSLSASLASLEAGAPVLRRASDPTGGPESMYVLSGADGTEVLRAAELDEVHLPWQPEAGNGAG